MRRMVKLYRRFRSGPRVAVRVGVTGSVADHIFSSSVLQRTRRRIHRSAREPKSDFCALAAKVHQAFYVGLLYVNPGGARSNLEVIDTFLGYIRILRLVKQR